MSNYEFWNELGKIFNAVTAYQEKSVEFNKRFINPWIRLGNVFDKQDRNTEAVNAYRNALELDPENAESWYELGNAYFRTEAYEDAVAAYNKAIERCPASGWAYNNLALSLVKQNKYAEAIPLYQSSIDLLRDDKDKAVAWNRLGNVYRKLNEYDQAVDAFQKADDLDKENAGFRDELDEVQEGPTLVEGSGGETSEEAAEVVPASIQLVIPEEPTDEAVPANDLQETAPSPSDSTQEMPQADVPPSLDVLETADESQSNILVPAAANIEADTQVPASDATGEILAIVNSEEEAAVDSTQGVVQATAEVIAVSDVAEWESVTSDAVQTDNAESQAEDLAVEPSGEVYAPEVGDTQTVTVITQNIVETYTDSQAGDETVNQTSDVAITSVATDTTLSEPDVVVVEQSPLNMETELPDTTSNIEVHEEAEVDDQAEMPVANSEVPEEAEISVNQEASAVEEEIVEISTQAPDDNLPPTHPAYEEFLNDNSDEFHVFVSETTETNVENQDSAASLPVTKMDPSGEIQIEVDTKNARVWNELGNVYFNTGAYEDAVTAYSKAIELDRGFAWPYSNLALTYVQKGRFVEAILLYQRSIELFSGEKDKAVSWNRLGNVYRRLNDYENAISAYQRADDLDPDNTTLSMQSRFSLLGNFLMDSNPSYAA